MASIEVDASLPITVFSSWGIESPTLIAGMPTVARYPTGPCAWVVVVSAAGTENSRRTVPSWRSFNSGVSPGTSTQVPVVCPTANLRTTARTSASGGRVKA
ncbi:Uncharacterised protein [Mycobacteroides abscessus subsp. abscessus]|nr:Uncharacterised protein [Mycobacteroides abscessus subsp. abscessus]